MLNILLTFFCCSGETDHFTNFAILLNGGGDACRGEEGTVIAWLSLALIIFAIVIGISAILLFELKKNRANKYWSKHLTKIEQLSAY